MIDPTILDFAKGIAAVNDEWKVTINLVEMDDQTQTLEAIIEGSDIDLEQLTEAINEMGGSLHSVDSVQVVHVL